MEKGERFQSGTRLVERLRQWAFCFLLLSVAGISLPLPLMGQSPGHPASGSRSDRAPVPTIQAVRTQRPPRIDGVIDDEAWEEAVWVGGFIQDRPLDGEAPTEDTRVAILFDGQALYMAVRLLDSSPNEIVGQLTRRDTFVPADGFWVDFDSNHDHRTGYQFGISAGGTRWEGATSDDNGNADLAWNPVWWVETTIDSLGWVVEARIPFSQFRFPDTQEQVWGINFARDIIRKNERVRWSWKPNEETGYPSRFGHLVGIRDIPSPRRLEVLPYVSVHADHRNDVRAGDPFLSTNDLGAEFGVDLKYGLASDLSLDLTVNPDFGQVEADPAVINLSAFETFYDERRPFFVEGASIFEFGHRPGAFGQSIDLFYSRRIGRTPSLGVSAPEGAYVDAPTGTRVLGAGKLSGTTGDWSLGMTSALTAREEGRIRYLDGSSGRQVVEPRATYNVLRGRRDFREGATGLGFMGTSVVRDLSGPVEAILHSSAWVGGVDLFHRFGEDRFLFVGDIAFSHVRGTPRAITRTQMASARYFQRPDQDHVAVDSTAESLSGYSGRFQLRKIEGDWLFNSSLNAFSPGFEVNDAGFEPRADLVAWHNEVTRRWLRPGPVFRTLNITGGFFNVWNFGGINVHRSVETLIDGQFLNYWGFTLMGSAGPGFMVDRGTWGGPLMKEPRAWMVEGSLHSDFRKPVWGALGVRHYENAGGSWEESLRGEIAFVPSPAVRFSLGGGYLERRNRGFYVTQLADPLGLTETSGRFVFGDLSQKELDITLRATVAFTPDLSLQLWAQPLIGSGDYREFKELARPGTFRFHLYGMDTSSTISLDQQSNSYEVDPDGSGPAEAFSFPNPDFTARSVRSNLVLRWEYSPGSTAYLVWTHGVSGSSPRPLSTIRDGLNGLLDGASRSTLLLKVSLWTSS